MPKLRLDLADRQRVSGQTAAECREELPNGIPEEMSCYLLLRLSPELSWLTPAPVLYLLNIN